MKTITWYDRSYLWELAKAEDIYQTPALDNWERCPLDISPTTNNTVISQWGWDML